MICVWDVIFLFCLCISLELYNFNIFIKSRIFTQLKKYMNFNFYPVQKSCIYQITSAMGKILSRQEWVLKSVPMNQHKCVAILKVYLWRNAYWVFIFWRWSLITVYSRNMQKSYMYWRSLHVRNVLYVCEMSSSISCKVSNGVSSCSFWTAIQQLTLRRRIKSHLLFAGIIRSSPFSLR